MEKIIGIDLGTTYSAISQWQIRKNGVRESKTYYITSEKDSPNVCPSKVYVEATKNNGINFVVGTNAEKKGIGDPANFISAVKRRMDNNEPLKLDAGTFTPVEISSEILKCLFNNVIGVEGREKWVPGGVVVTVPHYFKENQKANTRLAIKKALKDIFSEKINGIKRNNKSITTDDLLLGIVSEPVAAGLDYVLNTEMAIDGNYFVFDLGGGTFDVTIFKVTSENNSVKFEVLATDGLSRLGGEDFDESLLKWLLEDEGIDLDKEDKKKAMRFLRDAKEQIRTCKESLSSVEQSDIVITIPIGNNSHIEKSVSRDDLKKCMNGEAGSKIDFLSKIEVKIDDVLIKAGLSSNDINNVLLTGGSSKMLIIKDILKNKFGSGKIRNMENVDLAVSKGAAIYGAYLMDKKNNGGNLYLDRWKKITILERNAHDLAINIGTSQNPRYRVLIPGNSLLPTKSKLILRPTRFSSDGSKGLPLKIELAQGVPGNYEKIGTIETNEFYTHGKEASKINIVLTTILTGDNQIKVNVKIPKGKSDETDLEVMKDLVLNNSKK